MGISSRRIEDALLLRGSRDFDDLAAYRRFVDEVVGRRNARNAQADRARARRRCKQLPDAPDHRLRGGRSSPVTSTSGFILRRCSTPCPRA